MFSLKFQFHTIQCVISKINAGLEISKRGQNFGETHVNIQCAWSATDPTATELSSRSGRFGRVAAMYVRTLAFSFDFPFFIVLNLCALFCHFPGASAPNELAYIKAISSMQTYQTHECQSPGTDTRVEVLNVSSLCGRYIIVSENYFTKYSTFSNGIIITPIAE